MSQIINGNNSDVLDGLPDESIDCDIGSPAYYHQREYDEVVEQIYGGDKNHVHEWSNVPVTWRHPSPGDKPSPRSIYGNSDRTNAELRPAKPSLYCACGAWKGDLGLEPTPIMYVDHLCGIYDHLKPKLKKRGITYVNLGEKYNDSGGGPGGQTSYINNKARSPYVPPYKNPNIPTSSALCVPWLFCTKMVYEHGWILKDTLIWQKKVPMPYSGDRKYTLDYEPIFLFAKNPDYYFKPPKVKKKITRGLGHEFGGKKQADGGYCNEIYSGNVYNARKSGNKTRRTNLENFDSISIVDTEYLRFLEQAVYGEDDTGNVLKVNTSKTREKHHATWPVELVKILIESGCPPGGTISDIWGGVGNSAIAAAQLNRDYVLIELSPKYYEIAKRRVYNATADRDFVRNAVNLNELR
jgi:site-specific DNA-methyltransferase (cytosine-N4-specific)